MHVQQIERHRAGRTGWLRAAVLGANDGLLSIASLVLGVAAAHGNRSSVLIAGFAALVAGAMSMAAGEYVSVHSQKDTEDADLALERTELRTNDKGEHEELADIYVGRGLDRALAKKVADQLMAHDALGAHARDELGITPNSGSSSDPGGAGVSRQFHSRGGHAPGRGGPGSASERPLRRPGIVTRRARGSGSAGGADGRGADGARRLAGHLLGHLGDGRHGGRRRIVRNDCLRSIEANCAPPLASLERIRVQASRCEPRRPWRSSASESDQSEARTPRSDRPEGYFMRLPRK